MSNTKHTKGPWKVETHEGKLEIWSNKHFVASPEHELFYSAEKHGFKEANAHLIASAPDLLEALDNLNCALTELNSEGLLKDLGLDGLIQQAFDVSERAKGEPE